MTFIFNRQMKRDKKFQQWLGEMLCHSGEDEMLKNMWDAYKANVPPESVAAIGKTK